MTETDENWEKLPPVEKPNQGCACCPTPVIHRPLDSYLHPGFGGLCVSKGDSVVCPEIDPEEIRLSDVEVLAAADPDHDWRVRIDGPLHGETYQRQGDGLWVMVESNQGFA